MDPYSNEAYERRAALVAELNGESERAAAVVGVAWVEEAVQRAIESVLHPHEKARKALFSGGMGALTVEAKIELACLFGFMTDSIRSDLHIIRKIRNEFSHLIADQKQAKLSFMTDSVRSRCLELNCVAHLNLKDPREAFTRACAILNFDFNNIEDMSSKVPDCGRVFAERDGHPARQQLAPQ